MKLGTRNVLPFAISLLSHLQSAIDELQRTGVNFDDENFRKFLLSKIQTWNPKINGINVLDEETRKHALGFIAGIAINLTKGQ